MKYEIDENEDKLTVKATVPSRKMARDPVHSIKTKDILDILTKNGYNVGKYRAVKEGNCTNYKPESQKTDEWVFELKQWKEEEVAKKPSTPNRRRSAKSKTVRSKEDKLLRDENVGGVRTQTQTSVPGQDKEVSGE